MKHVWALGLTAFLATAAVAVGCGSDETSNATSSTTTNASTSSSSTGGGGDSLYDRLGGNAGITTVVGDFVGRVVGDPKINGYFMNNTVDGKHLTDCLVKQLGEATGGPEKYDCKDMKSVHEGMGISKADFDDLVGHLVAALQAAKVAQADIDTIAGVLLPMEKDIVENPMNNENIYQRLGRKPAVMTVIDNFIKRVTMDAEINGFFGTANVDRLKTCLVRQVCGATGGPCMYGKEVDGEPGVAAANPCKDMKTVHTGMKDDKMMPITKADFDALAGDLVEELKAAKVAQADIDAIVGVLAPMCEDIVADPAMCK